MCPVSLRLLSLLIVSRSLYLSLLWALLVLGCLLLFVGWLNLQSVAKWLVAISERRSVNLGSAIKTSLESGSVSSLLSTGFFRDPKIQAIDTSVTFGFLILSLVLAVVNVAKFDRDETRRSNKEYGYHIRVEEKIDRRLAWVHKLDEHEQPIEPQWKLAVCPGEDDPAFDPHCDYDVDFELSSTENGYCVTFTGEHARVNPIRCQ
jgi:hypothetical protein